MAQYLEDTAAGVEAEVDTATPESQGTEPTESTNTDAADFYGEDQSDQGQVETEEEPADDEAEEPIVAPVSLKAEEKEQFLQLPREAQQALSDILGRRDRETQQGLETARAAQRQAETSAADTIAEAQRDFAARSAQLIAAFAPQEPSLELLQQDPIAYMREQKLYEHQLGQFNAMIGELDQMHGQATSHFTQREQHENQERIKGLMSIPEFANEETRGQFIGELEKFGTGHLGYSVQQLAQMDATDMTALKRAMNDHRDAEKWRAHQKKRNERPRQAQGRFAAAPAGTRADAQVVDTEEAALRRLYPNSFK